MNLFHEAKKILDKDGKVNALGPYSGSKLTGQEIASYFKKHPVKDPEVKKAVEVALDLGGAFDVAGKEIQKFFGRKIRNSKEVKFALQYANEEVQKEAKDLNDAEFDIKQYSKMYKSAKFKETKKGIEVKVKGKTHIISKHPTQNAWMVDGRATHMIPSINTAIGIIMSKYEEVKEETISESPAMPSVQSGHIDLDHTDHTIDAGVINYVVAINKQINSGEFAKMHKERGTEVKARKASKYYRVETWEMGKAGSIHAFIEIATGDIFKPAGWKAPAKGARGNVTDNRYIEFVARYPRAYHGGHLYK